MSLLNVQSIWGKDCAMVDYFLSNNISMAIITETWLWDTEEDACRLSTSEYSTGLFSTIPSNRQNRMGGGILLVHRKSYKAELINEVFACSFQAAKFRIQVNKCNIILLSIYHPPYSVMTSCNQLVITDHGNKLLILGDFNIHMNDESDGNAGNFRDIIMVLGLEQHLHFLTHKAGNTLDLVMTELGSKSDVTKCSPGPFWSDHCAADFIVKLPMFSTVQEDDTIYIRKLCELDYERLLDDMHISDVLSMNDLSELVGAIDNNFQIALDSQAPLKKKQIPVRTRVPWFTSELKQQKQTVRNRGVNMD